MNMRAPAWLALLACWALGACGGGSLGGGTEPGEPLPSSIAFSAASNALASTADEADEGLLLTAKVLDQDGVAIPDADVSFSIVSGAGVLIAQPDAADGSSRAILTTGGDETERTIIVAATFGDLQETLDIDVVDEGAAPVRVTLSAASQELLSSADEASEGLLLTARAIDADGAIIPNSDIGFSILSGGGLLFAQPDADDGSSQAILTTGGDETPRTIEVAAVLGELQAMLEIEVIEDAPQEPVVARLNLRAVSDELPSSADEASEGLLLTAQAVNVDGAIIPNSDITFAILSGGGLLFPQPDGEDGSSHALLTTGGDPSNRTITVGARVGDVQASLDILVAGTTLMLLANTPQLPSSADQTSEGVLLIAQAIDSSGRLVPDSEINFSIPQGSGVLVLQDNGEDGSSRSVLTTGGDPTNRTITVTAEQENTAKTLDINVIGTTVSLTGPTTIGFGQEGEFAVEALDAEGDGIGGAAVSFSTTAGSLSVTQSETDQSGKASTMLLASTSGQVSATALGLSVEQDVQVSEDLFQIISPAQDAEIVLGSATPVTVEWLRSGSGAALEGRTVTLSSTRGTVTPSSVALDARGRGTVSISSDNAGGALIQAFGQDSDLVALQTVEFVASTATQIEAQADPAVIPINEQSRIYAIVRDDAGNLVKGKAINFNLFDVSGGTLSAASATTNSQGTAVVTYNASNITSADDGVEVTTTVRDAPDVAATVRLTVGGRTLFVTIGTGNELLEPNATTYQYPYSVSVVDAVGNPITDAAVRLAVVPVSYRKGRYVPVDSDDDGEPDRWEVVTARTCENEDVDYDGILDPAEDFNGNGVLDPGNVVTVPSTVELDEDGYGQFNLLYPQDRANWVTVELRAVVAVAGTETTDSAGFLLPVLAADVNNLDVTPPGSISPYGSMLNCSSPD